MVTLTPDTEVHGSDMPIGRPSGFVRVPLTTDEIADGSPVTG